MQFWYPGPSPTGFQDNDPWISGLLHHPTHDITKEVYSGLDGWDSNSGTEILYSSSTPETPERFLNYTLCPNPTPDQ